MNRKLLLIITTVFFLLVLCFAWDPYTPSASFNNEYAEIGVPLTVSVSGYPAGTSFAYQWTVGEKTLSVNSNTYTPTQEDLENFITVTVTPSGSFEPVTLSTYFSRLPVFYLTVEDEIARETYVTGALTIQGNSIYSDEQQLYSGPIQIHGRGNSTWTSYPKKPYKIKLDNSADLFGMGDSKHWVLLANYADESLMRDKIAYDLSGKLGMPYMESTWVTVIMNGEYIGNYLFCEQVRIAEDRVNITDLTAYAKTVAKAMVKAKVFPKSQQDLLEDSLEQDLTWLSTGVFIFQDREYDLTPYVTLPELTGGFLMEIDGYFDEISKFLLHGQPLMFKNPEYACTNEEIMTYAAEYFDAFFSALLDSDDFYTVFQGNEVSYTELFDIQSLAQYILIQEIFFNYDAALKSNFLYKDVSSLAYMGPIWDLDWSSGRDHSGISIEQWCSVYYTETADETLWYSGLLKDPYFLSVLKELWDTCYPDILALVEEDGILEQAYEYIYESGLANTELWLYQDGFTTSFRDLKSWLAARIQWLDSQFTSMDTLIASVGMYQADPMIEIHLSGSRLTVTAPSGSTAVLYWNGIRQESIQLEQQSASWQLPEDQIFRGSDVLLVRIYDDAGVLIGSNYIDRRSIE